MLHRNPSEDEVQDTSMDEGTATEATVTEEGSN